MKKTIILLALAFGLTTKAQTIDAPGADFIEVINPDPGYEAATDSLNSILGLTPVSYDIQEYTLPDLYRGHDTTYILEHPNAKDSALVISIVNGVVSVLPIKNPALSSAIKSPWFISGVTGLVFWIIRFFEKRRLRRKGRLVDREYQVQD